MKKLWIAVILLLVCGAGVWRLVHAATTTMSLGTPSYGVMEQLIPINDTTPVTLVPQGTRGFFIQPQTLNVSVRVGIGKDSIVNGTTQGILLNYTEALAEQVQTSTRFHEVKAISTGGAGNVWVVYYLP